jgi:hypothetical protein
MQSYKTRADISSSVRSRLHCPRPPLVFLLLSLQIHMLAQISWVLFVATPVLLSSIRSARAGRVPILGVRRAHNTTYSSLSPRSLHSIAAYEKGDISYSINM